MWLSGVTLVTLFIFLPETSAANILHRRARRLRKLTGKTNIMCESDIMASKETVKDSLIVLGRAFSLLFQEPIIFLLNLYVALIYGLLYVWFESFQLVFSGIYDFNLGEEGLAYTGILVGTLIAAPGYLWYISKYIEPQFVKHGEIKPEMRLPPTFVGSVCISICLFWFGWTARPSVHWIVPIIGSGFFAVGVVTLFNAVLNYLGDAYPTYAASVFAGNGLFRSSFGAGFPLFVSIPTP